MAWLSTSGRTSPVHRMSPRVSSATPVDEAPSPPVSERVPPSPRAAVSPTDSGLCPTPLHRRPSPAAAAGSPRSSPWKLERFFGDPPPRDAAPVTSSTRDPPRRDVIATFAVALALRQSGDAGRVRRGPAGAAGSVRDDDHDDSPAVDAVGTTASQTGRRAPAQLRRLRLEQPSVL